MSTSAAVLTKATFKLADRLKIQQDVVKRHDYYAVGRLTSVLFEGQRNTSGLSQSRARYSNSEQQKQLAAQGKSGEAMAPFSEIQAKLWASTTLDWLSNKNSPLVAVSRDRHDLLLPTGLAPLPPIPDPRWTPQHAQGLCPKDTKTGCSQCVPPRIAQKLAGCPIVGDRVCGKLTSRDGHVYGLIQPIITLCVLVPHGSAGFIKIRCDVDPADGTHMALLIDDANPHRMEGFFVGGRFQLGG